jgi:leucyl-tRNA synthetase
MKRVWHFAYTLSTEAKTELPAKLSSNLAAARREIHLGLKQATYDLDRQQFNTVASTSMKILNTLEKVLKEAEQDWQSIAHEGLSILLRLLSPLTPHIAQTLWKELGYGDDILCASWPQALESAMVQDEVEMMIQVNGKLRGSVSVGRTISNTEIEQLVVVQDCVAKFLVDGASVRKIIVVPSKLINVVIG